MLLALQLLNLLEGAGSPVAPTITTTSLGGVRVGETYLTTLEATGDTPITWAVTVGALPTGLSLDANTGVISGTPSLAESQTFTVEATNATGTDTQELTITITAALEVSSASGGYGFWNEYDREQIRRKRRRKELADLEAERERIEDEQAREIAKLLQEQEAKDARREELQRLSSLVASYSQANAPSELSPRVQKAIAVAAERQTTWALMALDRELRRAREEEEFLLEALKFAIEYG